MIWSTQRGWLTSKTELVGIFSQLFESCSKRNDSPIHDDKKALSLKNFLGEFLITISIFILTNFLWTSGQHSLQGQFLVLGSWRGKSCFSARRQKITNPAIFVTATSSCILLEWNILRNLSVLLRCRWGLRSSRLLRSVCKSHLPTCTS